jgi:phage gp29-like protein
LSAPRIARLTGVVHRLPTASERLPVEGKLLASSQPEPLESKPSPTRQAPPISWELYTDHPGYGLTPARVWDIFQAAESGYPQAQVDLFEDLLENDGHLRGLCNSRSNAVSGKPFVLQPGEDTPEAKECAAALEERIRGGRLNTQDMFEHQLDSSLYGYAGSEIAWEFSDGLFYPAWFHNVPHRRWVFDKFGQLRILTRQEDHTGVLPKPGGWVLSRARHTNPARGGILRTASWFAMFKRFSVRDWVIKCEKFGIPGVLGFYKEGASPDSIAALKAAVRDLGEAGHAVLSDFTELKFADLPNSGDVSALHPSMIALCEAQMSKLVTGSVLTSDTGGAGAGGSYALGRVHAGVRFDIVLYEAMRLGRAFVAGVSEPFARYNGFTCKPPQLKIQISQELDQFTRAKIFELAQRMGYDVGAAQLSEELALTIAQDDRLEPINTPTEVPAAEERDDA